MVELQVIEESGRRKGKVVRGAGVALPTLVVLILKVIVHHSAPYPCSAEHFHDYLALQIRIEI